jgi:hypothetical protein
MKMKDKTGNLGFRRSITPEVRLIFEPIGSDRFSGDSKLGLRKFCEEKPHIEDS